MILYWFINKQTKEREHNRRHKRYPRERKPDYTAKQDVEKQENNTEALQKHFYFTHSLRRYNTSPIAIIRRSDHENFDDDNKKRELPT